MDWELHKKVYLSELDALDDEIRSIVLSDPDSEEAQNLNERVQKRIELLTQEQKNTNI